jgi:DMSO/TMAO reductase YedYZ molybdopterin-dependent catalytic subunit
MSDVLSRREFITGSVVLGGMVLTGCDTTKYLPPKVRAGAMGAADVLTMASQRLLLTGQGLVQEHDIRDVTKNFPTWGDTNPEDDGFQRLLRANFADWRLAVGGLVNQPTELSLDQLKRLPRRTQITMHICEQGWSAIAEWTGAPLLEVLKAAGGVTPAARYVVVDTYDGAYEGYDMFDVVHPQTILAYGMNGRDLPLGNGAPVRLRVERQCGYKNLKFVKSINVVHAMDRIGKGTGGINSDHDWHWYAGEWQQRRANYGSRCRANHAASASTSNV